MYFNRCCNFRKLKERKKERWEYFNYKNLTTEMECLWNVKTEVIPLKLEATGIIPKSFIKYMNNVMGKHEIKEVQKAAILDIAPIFQRATYKMGNNIICTINCDYRIAENMQTTVTRFASVI